MSVLHCACVQQQCQINASLWWTRWFQGFVPSKRVCGRTYIEQKSNTHEGRGNQMCYLILTQSVIAFTVALRLISVTAHRLLLLTCEFDQLPHLSVSADRIWPRVLSIKGVKCSWSLAQQSSNWRFLTTIFVMRTLSKSLRLALIRLPDVNFSENVTLRIYGGSIQPHSRPQPPFLLVTLSAKRRDRGNYNYWMSVNHRHAVTMRNFCSHICPWS